MSTTIGVEELEAAAARIAGHVVRTPTLASPGLSALLGVPVTVKLELLQRTGSFKVRGAALKLLTLTDEQRAAGVVAVSGGNHGVAVAEMSASLGVRATVVMPRTAPARSVEAARAAGADVRLTATMAEAFALMERLETDGLTLLHPFADPVVITGQGTVGLELAADAGELTDVLVSIGGGGLIAGVAAALRALRPGVRVWGVEPSGADAMSQALAHGGPVQVSVDSRISTLSAPTVSPLTYAMVRDLVDEVLVVPEAEAYAGVRELAEHAKVWAEPAAGCLLPAARRVLAKTGERTRLGLVVCGGNASVDDVTAYAG
ncbi:MULTISPECIES: threonine/serine dehydratase [Streptomyces]|uniref:Serine/threonine dehydratase n=1 Tax=Streptomyces alfalfae TaxID=1642299 RepID=A0ABM6GLQ5_9ACTN|nr:MULTISPECIES: threonine/serine dehydratase [Streptomyces]APY84621.1 serine/threonine dehydratase [Streptomyces alfalfae]KUL63881.1 threonine dehydratase [Streptomyces sp. NRRL S-1521]THC46923.1 threonine/serine dehydratase [Streptomyces sp. A1499]